MKEDETSDVQKLLRLKRYESPGEEYFEDFVSEFKDRQRSEMLQQSSVSLLTERASMWFNEIGPSKWLIPAGAAAAMAAGYVAFAPAKSEQSNQPAQMAVRPVSENQQPADPEIIELKIPKIDRVPGLAPGHSDPSVLPASARGFFREL